MGFETLKPLFLVLLCIILSSFEPVWKLLQFLEFSIQLLKIQIFFLEFFITIKLWKLSNILDIFEYILLKRFFENFQIFWFKRFNFLG